MTTTTSPRPTEPARGLLDRVTLRPAIDSRPPAEPRGSEIAAVSSRGAWNPTLFDEVGRWPPRQHHREPGPPAPVPPRQALLVTLPGAEPAVVSGVDPLVWVRRFVPALLEVLHGRRPPAQLVRWVDEPVLDAITSELRRRHRRRPVDQLPATVASIRVQCPQPSVVEVAVRVQSTGRSYALALALRAHRDRWLCTDLDVGDGAVWQSQQAARAA